MERGWVHSGEGYEAQLVCIVHAEPTADVSFDTFSLVLPFACINMSDACSFILAFTLNVSFNVGS